jgi:hypothetical protein
MSLAEKNPEPRPAGPLAAPALGVGLGGVLVGVICVVEAPSLGSLTVLLLSAGLAYLGRRA